MYDVGAPAFTPATVAEAPLPVVPVNVITSPVAKPDPPVDVTVATVPAILPTANCAPLPATFAKGIVTVGAVGVEGFNVNMCVPQVVGSITNVPFPSYVLCNMTFLLEPIVAPVPFTVTFIAVLASPFEIILSIFVSNSYNLYAFQSLPPSTSLATHADDPIVTLPVCDPYKLSNAIESYA